MSSILPHDPKKPPKQAQKRIAVVTDYRFFRWAQHIWQWVFISLSIDVFFLLSSHKSSSIPTWAYSAYWLVPIFLSLPIAYLERPRLQGIVTDIRARAQKKRRFVLLFIILAIAFPIIEVVIHLGGAGAIGISVALIVLLIGGIQIFRYRKSWHGDLILQPRNYFLRVNFYDRRNFIMYIGAVISARISSLAGSTLYFYRAWPIMATSIVILAGIILLALLKPSWRFFFSVCPQCRAPRSHALDEIYTCPACNRKKIYY